MGGVDIPSLGGFRRAVAQHDPRRTRAFPLDVRCGCLAELLWRDVDAELRAESFQSATIRIAPPTYVE